MKVDKFNSLIDIARKFESRGHNVRAHTRNYLNAAPLL